MNDINLEKAFLQRFTGAVLRIPKKGRVIPGSIDSMVDPRDRPFCKLTRFKFLEKTPSENIVNFLREYYDNIGWRHDIYHSPSDIVIIWGNVWPTEVGRLLCPAGIFEKDRQGVETNIFCYSLNPTIG